MDALLENDVNLLFSWRTRSSAKQSERQSPRKSVPIFRRHFEVLVSKDRTPTQPVVSGSGEAY